MIHENLGKVDLPHSLMELCGNNGRNFLLINCFERLDGTGYTFMAYKRPLASYNRDLFTLIGDFRTYKEMEAHLLKVGEL